MTKHCRGSSLLKSATCSRARFLACPSSSYYYLRTSFQQFSTSSAPKTVRNHLRQKQQRHHSTVSEELLKCRNIHSKHNISIPASKRRYSSASNVNEPSSPTSKSDGTEDGNKPKDDAKPQSRGEKGNSSNQRVKEILIKSLIETAGFTLASLILLVLAGLAYQNEYQKKSVRKIEEAFRNGDPAFTLSMNSNRTGEQEGWVDREKQELLNNIMTGRVSGRYYLLTGEKGTGKTSMILEAMRKAQGANCTMFDAHADPEIFRIRLGKALDFEFYEDYIGAMFSLRGPRDTTALLDIERAFNKLEEVALKMKKTTNNPLVLIINNVHLIRDNEEGQNLIELLQQKAETLSGSRLVTMIFNSDDYWVYERLRKLGTRLEVIQIKDLSRKESIEVIQRSRRQFFNEEVSKKKANKIYNLVGGRPLHLTEVTSQKEVIKACHKLIDRERTWFLNQCGLLGENMDDDVMESGKFSYSAMLLMRALVKLDNRSPEQTEIHSTPDETIEDDQSLDFQPEREERLDHNAHYCSKKHHQEDHILPELPLWIARKVMTRPDYIQTYDNLNIFTIDATNSIVRADSVPMMQAFREIASMPGFDDLLDETMDRVSAIESLGRTRELVAKDLVLKGVYRIETGSAAALNGSAEKTKKRSWFGIPISWFWSGQSAKTTVITLVPETEEEEDLAAPDLEEGSNTIEHEELDEASKFNISEDQKLMWWNQRNNKLKGLKDKATSDASN